MKVTENKITSGIVRWLSESAKSDFDVDDTTGDAIARALAPYTLSKEEIQEFEKSFFPGRKDIDSNAPVRTTYQDLLTEMVSLSFDLSRVFGLLQFMVGQGSALEDLEYDEQIDHLDRVVAQHSKFPDDKDKGLKEFLAKASTDLSSGSHHVIKPSDKYKGGLDIVFSGVPNRRVTNPTGLKLPSGAGHTIQKKPDAYEYEQEKHTNYLTDLSQKSIRLAEAIQEKMIGRAVTVKNAHKRVVLQLPLDFDFEEINQMIFQFLGLRLSDKKMMHNVDGNVANRLKKYVSLVVILDPEESLITAHSKNIKLKEMGEAPDAVENSSIITTESLALTPNISISYALNIPENFVNYICQNDTGDLRFYCVDTWVAQWCKGYLRPRNSSRSIAYDSLPRFILPISKTANITQDRTANDYYVDPGRTDDNGITTGVYGSLMYIPKTEEMQYNRTAEYEKDLDTMLQTSFESGLPAARLKTPTAGQLVEMGSSYEYDEIVAAQERVQDYSGMLLGVNWDLNAMVTANATDASTQILTSLEGATVPSALTVSDYLGFNFAEEGEKENAKTFPEAVSHLLFNYKEGDKLIGPVDLVVVDENNKPKWVKIRPMQQLMQTYAYLVQIKQAPDLPKIVQQAKSELGISSLGEDPYEKGLYGTVMNNDCSLRGYELNATVHMLTTLLADCAKDASGEGESNLLAVTVEEDGYMVARDSVQDKERYFNPRSSKLSDFGNLYKYLGGLVFQKACEAIVQAPKDVLFSKKHGVEALDQVKLPGFLHISMEVLPLAVLYAKYVPEAVEIYMDAENTIETYRPEENADVEDIRIPGIKEGSKMFPHQISVHGTLRKRPKEAVLDVAPGGGKTIMLLADAACCINEDPEEVRPLIICPGGLVANWCEDMVKISNGTWNVIPLTTQSWNRWGPERLDELIKNSPPNTIFVVGMSLLTNKTFEVSYGTRRIKVGGVIEFLKRFKFNYIAIDESHKAKNLASQRHKAIKELTTLGFVKYIRLATGTLISNTLPDVVGQGALLSSHIFRTKELFDEEYKDRDNDRAIRIRSKLGNHAAVMTKKRKHWAFMLPNPIDIAHPVLMVTTDNPGSDIHGLAYQSVLRRVVDELESELKKKSKKQSNESEDDGGLQEEGSSDLGADDADEKDELFTVDKTKLQRNIQRLEQIITDPNGDDTFKEAAELAGLKNFVSNKIRTTIRRLDNHFTSYDRDKAPRDPETGKINHAIIKWEKGQVQRELDLVEYLGVVYLSRKFSDQAAAQDYDSPSIISPDKDPDRWKPEIRGKVLIFCRYKRSVDAVFEALPPKYKSMARKFHSGVGNRWENLNDFRNDPDVKILIANEQAITEGHNLQVASRIIRVEHPWTPGDYDQSTARIFRPDPAAAKLDENGKPGDMPRELILIDWLMTENTLEIPKIARLMQKTVDKVRFDEKGNTKYDTLINMEKYMDTPGNFTEDQIAVLSKPIKLNLEMIKDASTFDDYRPHFILKAKMNSIEGNEFSEMRKTTVASMIDLPVVPPNENFARIENVPILSNQNIADPDNFGLIRISDLLSEYASNLNDQGAQLLESDLDTLLIKQPVKTEFGTGLILGYKKRFVTDPVTQEKGLDQTSPVSTIKVRYGSTDKLDTKVDVKSSFIAKNVSEKDYDTFFKTDKPWLNDRERNRIEKARKKEEQAAEETDKDVEDEKKKDRDSLASETRKKRKASKRRDNIASGKPVNAGVRIKDDLKDVPKAKPGIRIRGKDKFPATGEKDNTLKIVPTMYDGFIAIHANHTDPDSVDLGQFGFVPFGEFLYIESELHRNFITQIMWISNYIEKAGLEFDKATVGRMEAIQDAFEYKKTGGFNLKLALKTQADLPQFYKTRHTEAAKKDKVKIYTQVLPDRVRMVIDTRTNPKLKKLANKTVPKSEGGKFKLHEGMHIYLATSKPEANKKLKEVQAGGYTISNIESVVEALRAIKTVRKSSR